MAIELVGEGHPAVLRVVPLQFTVVQPNPGRSISPTEHERSQPAMMGARIGCNRRGELAGDFCLDCSHMVAWRALPSSRKLTVFCTTAHTDRVEEWMTPAARLVTAAPEEPCRAADERAEAAHVHHLPVLDPRRALVGLVSRKDLAGGGALPVAARMSQEVFAVAPNTQLGVAAAAMRSLDIGSLPIVGHALLLGLITRSDLLRAGVPEALFE